MMTRTPTAEVGVAFAHDLPCDVCCLSTKLGVLEYQTSAFVGHPTINTWRNLLGRLQLIDGCVFGFKRALDAGSLVGCSLALGMTLIQSRGSSV
jgi:hypothetical protein